MRYAIVIERAQRNYAAYVPDLPGCVATGTTLEETEQQIREAIEFTSKVCVRTEPRYPSHPAAWITLKLQPEA